MIKKILKKHQHLLVTICLYILILAILKSFKFKDLTLLNVSPNPYILINFILSSLWGLSFSIYNSIFFFIFIALFNHLQIDQTTVETIWAFEFVKLPLYNAIISIFLGEIKYIQQNKYKKLQQLNTLNKNHSITLEESNSTLLKESSHLRTRIVNQFETLNNLYSLAQRFNSLEPMTLLNNISKYLKNNLKVTKAKIYFNKDMTTQSSIDLVSTIGSQDIDNKFIHMKDIGDQITNKAISSKEIAWLNPNQINLSNQTSKDQSMINESSALIAAPILNKNQAVIGLLIIDQIDFLKFNEDSIKIIKILVLWLNDSLKRVSLYNDTKNKNIRDELYNIYTKKYFYDRLDEEFSRAQSFMIPLTLITVTFNVNKDLVQKKEIIIKKAISQIILSNIRKIDCLSIMDAENSWAIILPIISPEETSTRLEKIHKDFSLIDINNEDNIKVTFKTRDFSSEMLTFQDMINDSN